MYTSSQLAGKDAVGAASFLTVDWAASPGMAEQHVKVGPALAGSLAVHCVLVNSSSQLDGKDAVGAATFFIVDWAARVRPVLNWALKRSQFQAQRKLSFASQGGCKLP